MLLLEVGDIMYQCYKRGWITSRDGNISIRFKGQDHLLITPSGVVKYQITDDKLVKVSLADPDDSLQNKPSGEIRLHLSLQNTEQTDRVVLHAHPTNIIAAMYAGWDLQELAKEFPEVNRYTRVGPNVPYHPPLTEGLAKATGYALGVKEDGSLDYDIVGLDRHGVIVVAESLIEAFEDLERLEHICEIVLKSGREALTQS